MILRQRGHFAVSLTAIGPGLSSTSPQRTMQPVAQAYVVKCISRSSFIYALGRAIERRILLLETYLGGRVSSSDEENILSLDF